MINVRVVKLGCRPTHIEMHHIVQSQEDKERKLERLETEEKTERDGDEEMEKRRDGTDIRKRSD